MIGALQLAIATSLTRAAELARTATAWSAKATSPLVLRQPAAQDFFRLQAEAATAQAAAHREAVTQLRLLLTLLETPMEQLPHHLAQDERLQIALNTGRLSAVADELDALASQRPDKFGAVLVPITSLRSLVRSMREMEGSQRALLGLPPFAAPTSAEPTSEAA